MGFEGVPWQCVDCGELGIHRGKGRKPERCDADRAKHKAARERQYRAAAKSRAAAARDLSVVEQESSLTSPDPEPLVLSGATDYAPAAPPAPGRANTAGAPTNQWGRRGKVPVSLAGCPDPAEDLPGARIWVIRNVFGVEPYSWQKRELYRLGGRPRPRRAYIQLGRKNGKSAFACFLILTEMILVPNSAVYAVSDSERNLNSAMVRELKGFILKSPEADGAFVITTSMVEYPHNGSFFEVRPNKFAATQSINPTLVVIDEVHLQKNDEVWEGMALADPGGVDFLLLGITTPGYDLSSFAHELYTQVKAGNPVLYGKIFEPDNLECDSSDEEAWKQSNPRLEDYPEFIDVIREQHAASQDHEFRRFRLGIWTATESAWFPYGVWDALSVPGRLLTPETADPGQRLYLGFDGSYSGDSTALIACQGLHVSVAAAWENPGAKGWRVPRDDVEATVTRWMNAGRHVYLVADPPYWARELGEWARRWPNRVIEFPTHTRARMAPACTTFHAAVMDGTLTHDGDKRLARHISNAVAMPSPQGDYITKPDPGSPAKIDLAVAAVVAFSMSSAAHELRHPAGAR